MFLLADCKLFEYNQGERAVHSSALPSTVSGPGRGYSAAGKPMARERILVVDDEQNIVELAQMYLEQAGYSVESARDGQEALTRVRHARPALVVLDLMLPGLDGWEVCRRLRAESDVPIIMLTARSDDVDRIVGLELGADDYVTKPFNPRELVARVSAVLRRSAGSVRPGRAIAVGKLAIDPGTRDVLSYRARETRLSTTGFTYVDSIVGSNVPFVHQTSGHRLCQLVGTGACSSISVHDYRRDDPGGSWIDLDTYVCLPATYLNVNLALESYK